MKDFPQSVPTNLSVKLNFQLSLDDVEVLLTALDSLNRLASEPKLSIPQALNLSKVFYRFDTPRSFPIDVTLFDRLYEPIYLYRETLGFLDPVDEDDQQYQILHDEIFGAFAITNADMTGLKDDH